MSLRWRILLLLASAFAVMGGITFLVQRTVVLPHTLALERRDALQDMDRCVEAIGRELEFINRLCGDWAAWNDTYAFVVDRNESYAAANFTAETFDNNGLDLIVVFTSAGQTAWAGGRNPATGDAVSTAELLEQIRACPRLVHHQDVASATQGLLLTGQGPLLTVSRPIITSKNEGPIRGSLLMGRYLTGGRIDALRRCVRVDVDITAVTPSLPADRTTLAAATLSSPRVEEESRDLLHVHRALAGLDGAPALVLDVRIPRHVSRRGRIASGHAVMSIMGLGGIVLLLTFLELNRSVLRPLSVVTRHAETVAEREDWGARLNLRRNDEVGRLADQFDRMMAKLQECHGQMVETAHRAGMAEMAGEVLHNAGNALNSANISAETLQERLGDSRVAGVTRLAEFLQVGSDAEEPARSGQQVLNYVQALSETLCEEHRSALAQVADLRARLDHVLEIIAIHQSYAGRTRLVETQNLAAVVDDTLRVQAPLFDKLEIDVQRTFEPLPPMRVERNRLMQVLLNLFRNAADAMAGIDGPRVLKVRVFRPDDQRIAVAVEDNGPGVDEQHRAQLFRSGFTTKAQGHGIGLHFCANACSAMGGEINFTSPGSRGSIFTLWLPLEPAGELG